MSESIFPRESEQDACHTRSNSIFLLQQVLGDLLHHCFQQLWPEDCDTLEPAIDSEDKQSTIGYLVTKTFSLFIIMYI